MAIHFTQKKKLLAAGLGLLLMIWGVFFILHFPASSVSHPVIFGATFSPQYAESLGLDWKEVYRSTLDDLGIKEYRLSVYWDRTEQENGKYDFSETDYQLQEAQKRGAKVLLAIGRKLPRWPECHEPSWLQELPKDQRDTELLSFIAATVEHYKDNPTVYAWQVENEPFFPFGSCAQLFGKDILSHEVSTVRAIDSRQIIVTEGGEWGFWFGAAYYADQVGISMYRESWNKIVGQIKFPIGPGYYQMRANILSWLGKSVFVTELQVEPWGPKNVQDMSLEESNRYFPLSKMKSNIQFAREAGFEKNYLWGVEWWYLARLKGDPTYWNEGKKIFKGDFTN